MSSKETYVSCMYLASRSVAHLGETLGMRTSMDHILASEQEYTRGHVR